MSDSASSCGLFWHGFAQGASTKAAHPIGDMSWKLRPLLPERSIPEAFGVADGNDQFVAHLPQRDVGSKDFERPGLAPPARIASSLAEQLPARFERHLDIDFVPHGKLTRTQLIQVFDTLHPKLGNILEIVEAETTPYSFNG